MPISNNEQLFLSLLACELFKCEIPDTFPSDWSNIYAIAQRHAVTPLIYPAIKCIPFVPAEIVNHFRSAAIYSYDLSDRILKGHQEVIGLMDSMQITCSVLKGVSVARLYPHPKLRVPGDIDLLVNPQDIQGVCNAMVGAGYEFSHSTDKHYCYHKDGISIEIHHMASEFPDNKKGNYAREYMRMALNHTQRIKLNGIAVPMLLSAYQLVSLLAHMEHHLTGTGIGLRQFCDWAITVNAYRDEIGEEALAILDRCGLLEFAKVSTRLCEKYLGLPHLSWTANVSEEAADALMHDLLESGNFHEHKIEQSIAVSMMDSYNIENSRGQSTLRSYLKYVKNRIHEEYPQRRRPLWVAAFAVFYPARWTVRMLAGKRQKFNLKESVRSAREREKLLQGLKLYK